MPEKTINILISDELKSILQEIEADSLVAHLLLKKTHLKDELVDSPVNYISLSKVNKGHLSYLSQDRIDVLVADGGDLWGTSKRYNSKSGSFVTKLFKDISAKEVEKFSNLLRAEVSKPSFTFKIVNGEDIKKYYYYQNYHSSDRGTLGMSCMKHEHCQRYFDLYVQNPEVVSMLCMFNDDDRLIGRALLWHFDQYKLMDRIYTNNDEEFPFFFKKWASSNGYLYKSEQNWFNTLNFEKLGDKKTEIQTAIQLKNFDLKFFPYMDTFKFIDRTTGKLYNYMPLETEIRTLCGSDGSNYDSNYLKFDGIDRVFRYRGDSVFLDYLNLFTSSNNVEWSNSNDKYILRVDGIWNDEIRDFIFIEEKDHMNNKEAIEERRRMYAEQDSKRKSLKKSQSQVFDVETESRFYPFGNMDRGTAAANIWGQIQGRVRRAANEAQGGDVQDAPTGESLVDTEQSIDQPVVENTVVNTVAIPTESRAVEGSARRLGGLWAPITEDNGPSVESGEEQSIDQPVAQTESVVANEQSEYVDPYFRYYGGMDVEGDVNESNVNDLDVGEQPVEQTEVVEEQPVTGDSETVLNELRRAMNTNNMYDIETTYNEFVTRILARRR